MNILKKLPLIKIAALVLMVSVITSAMGFAGTYSWFMGDLEVNETVTMGTVDIELNGNTIKNNSNIPIYLRVRVIVEWTQNGQDVLGQPGFNKSPVGDGWQWIDAEDGGVFLVYTTEVKPDGGKTPLSVPDISITTAEPGWQATLTLIAEAIQAGGKAVEWTVGNDTPGVVDWTGGMNK